MKSSKAKDEVGNTYGYLTVIEYSEVRPEKESGAFWRCKCVCGKMTVTKGTLLRNGNTRSCGCKSNDLRQASKTQGSQKYRSAMGRTPEELNKLHLDNMPKDQRVRYLPKREIKQLEKVYQPPGYSGASV